MTKQEMKATEKRIGQVWAWVVDESDRGKYRVISFNKRGRTKLLMLEPVLQSKTFDYGNWEEDAQYWSLISNPEQPELDEPNIEVIVI